MDIKEDKNLNSPLIKVLKSFLIMWILTAIGMAIGSQLPIIVCFMILILSIVILIICLRLKNVDIAKILMYVVPFLTGFMFYYTVLHYVTKIGLTNVLGLLVLTVGLFAGAGFVGYVTVKRDISGMGQFLFYALIVLIIVSIIAIYFSTPIIELIISTFGIMIFTLYTLYDFNTIRKAGVQEFEVPLVALKLYFDFLNLFINILKFFSRLFIELLHVVISAFL